MNVYPPAFSADQFKDVRADSAEGKKKRRYRGMRLASSDDALKSPADTVSFGITKLFLEGPSGQVSLHRTLNTPNSSTEAVAAGTASRFFFAPKGKIPPGGPVAGERPNEGEIVKIKWELVNPASIAAARIELYHRFSKNPIWTQRMVWRNGVLTPVPVGEDSDTSSAARQTTGEMDWDGSFETIDSNLIKEFPAKCVHHSRSPYKLKMVVEGTDGSDGHPAESWTYFDVAVASITLKWGEEAWIPTARTDGLDNETWTHNQEVDLFRSLSSKSLTDTGAAGVLEVSLRTRVVNGGGLTDSDSVSNHRKAWGEGPLIPLCAEVKMRDSAGNAKRAPNAIAGGRFLWDWEDEPATKVQDWIGAPNGHHGRPDHSIQVSELSRLFIETTLALDRDNTRHPWDSNNCPARFGGKRGAGPCVFPASDGSGSLPYKVLHECSRRPWAAVSFGEANPRPQDTAILFQPSRFAGDRYKVAVYPTWYEDESGALGLDAPDAASASTLRALCGGDPQATPHAVTRRFEVFRRVNLMYWYSPGVVRADENRIKDQYRNEGGIIFDYHSGAIPLNTLYARYDDYLHNRFNFTGWLIMHIMLELPRPATASPDYFVEARSFTQAKTYFSNLCRDNPWYRLDLTSVAGLTNPVGPELTSSGGAKGWVIRVDGNTALVLGRNTTAFANGQTVTVPDNTNVGAGATINSAKTLKSCWGITVNMNHTTRLKSGHAKVTEAGSAETANLDFPSGVFRSSRYLDDAVAGVLTAMLDRVYAAAPAPKTLTFTIEAPAGGDRDNTRNANIEAAIREHLFDAKAAYDTFCAANMQFNTQAEYDKVVRGEAGSIASALVGGHTQNDGAFANKPWIVAVHMLGSRNPQLFTSGFWDTGSSRSDAGWCFNWVPPPPPAKRQYKGGTPLIVHEIGHGLFLDHAMDRQPQDKDPSGHNETRHVVWDTCVMNYDPDTEGFCGMCCFKMRGWDISSMSPTAEMTPVAWTAQALTKWQADVNAVPNNHNYLTRLAWFKHRSAPNGTAGPTPEGRTALAHMNHAEATLSFPPGSPGHISFLRTMALYHKRACGDNGQRDHYKTRIQGHSTEALDVSGL